MTEVWDLMVVGGGPAGSAAALAALATNPNARVLIVDRVDFPRDKACGDGIAPHVVDVLRPLGAGDVVGGWTPLRRLDLAQGRAQVAGRLARPVWVIPREVFDARLVDRAVRAGATLARHRVRDVRHDRDLVVVDDAIRARLLIAADGVHSAVRAATGAPPTTRRALAIRGYTPTPAAYDGRQVIRFGEGEVPSYAWAFDCGDGRANVGYGELSGDRRVPSRAMMLERLEELLPGTVPGGSRWRGHHLPLSGWGTASEQPEGRILYVGDAAGLVNPMTGEGIYYAVATGALAGGVCAEALGEGRPSTAGTRHRRATRRLLGRHLHHTWVASRLIRSPALVRAGITAAAADRGVFDALVELGLGGGRITPRIVRGLAVHLTGH